MAADDFLPVDDSKRPPKPKIGDAMPYWFNPTDSCRVMAVGPYKGPYKQWFTWEVTLSDREGKPVHTVI